MRVAPRILRPRPRSGRGTGRPGNGRKTPTIRRPSSVVANWPRRPGPESARGPDHAPPRRPPVPRRERPLARPDRRARSLIVDHLGAFVRWAQKAGYRPHYVRNLIRAVQSLYHWGAAPIEGRYPTRILAENPIAGYRAPRLPEAPDRYVEPA